MSDTQEGNGLDEMLTRASETLGDAPADAGPQQGPVEGATISITVENFPGLCMGASMLMSLAMAKVGYGPLSDIEGRALTDALLKNATAWDLGGIIGNPRIAAAVDLGGCLVAIMTPRILADLQRASVSPVQAATVDRMTAGDVDQPSPA